MQSKYEVVLSLDAQNDLNSIAACHQIKFGVASPQQIMIKLLDKIAILKDFPDKGGCVPSERISKAGFRILLVGKYLCFYNRRDTKVIVHHIVHGSTSYIKHLFSENP